MEHRLFSHDDLPQGAEFFGGFATMTEFGKSLVLEVRLFEETADAQLEDFQTPTGIDYEAYAYACLCENNGAYMLVADPIGFLAYYVG